MIRKSDIQWWTLQISKEPESAPAVVEELAKRLVELDAENERLRNEALRLQGSAPAAPADSAQVSALQRKVDTLQNILKGQAATETAVILVSDSLQTARMPLSQVRLRLQQNLPALDRTAVLGLRCLLLARPQDDLLLLTSQGRLFKVLLHKVPYLVEGSGWPAADGPLLDAGERVTAAIAIARQPRFWTVVTRRGYVKQLLRAGLDKAMGQSAPLIKSPLRNDEPVAMVNGDRGDLLVITRWGKAIRFPQRAIAGQGEVALEVEPDDEVAAALPLPSDAEILILTAAGYVMRRDTTRFGARSKPGGPGRTLIQAYDVLGAFPYARRGKLLYLTYSGKFVAIETAGIPLLERVGKGTQTHDLSRDPAVAVTFAPGALL